MMLWYVARGAGLAALVLLSAATCLGALTSRDGLAARLGNPGTRYLLQYLHRTCAGLGLATLVLHVGTIIADSYAHVGVGGALVPFTAGYRPSAVAFGSLAAYTFVAVSMLGLARGRLARSPRAARSWRALHALSYLGWGSAILHGFLAGTDSALGWVRVVYVCCLAAVVAALGTRLLTRDRPDPRDRFAPLEGATP
jgi:hypothetical protein